MKVMKTFFLAATRRVPYTGSHAFWKQKVLSCCLLVVSSSNSPRPACSVRNGLGRMLNGTALGDWQLLEASWPSLCLGKFAIGRWWDERVASGIACFRMKVAKLQNVAVRIMIALV